MSEIFAWLLDTGFIMAGLTCGWCALQHWQKRDRLPGPWQVLAKLAPGESAWVAGWFEPVGADSSIAIVEKVELLDASARVAHFHNGSTATFVDPTGRFVA